MKVLVAIDNSGSMNHNKTTKVVASTLKNICPDSKVELGLFDINWMGTVSVSDYFNQNFNGGGGSLYDPVLEQVDNYDKVFVVTDGYMPEVDFPENVSIVLVSED